jgi:hypothetical protein
MTYRQYSDHIKFCQYLGKDTEGEYKVFYDFITELWRDMEFTVVNEQRIIFHKGENFLMDHDFKNGWLDCDYDQLWSFFRNTNGMEIYDTKDFVRGMVEEHLKCKVLTPTLVGLWKKFEWRNI